MLNQDNKIKAIQQEADGTGKLKVLVRLLVVGFGSQHCKDRCVTEVTYRIKKYLLIVHHVLKIKF